MTDYKTQGEDFLKNTRTTMEVVETVPQRAPLWAEDGKHGIQYAVTLKNARGAWTFDFWGSIADAEMIRRAEAVEKSRNTTGAEFFKVKDYLKEKGFPIGISALGIRMAEKTRDAVKPSAYDVLACLDILYGDTFEDFCYSFGYDTDSIRAEKTYRAVLEQDRMLRKLFSSEELEKLMEIN